MANLNVKIEKIYLTTFVMSSNKKMVIIKKESVVQAQAYDWAICRPLIMGPE